MQRIVPFVFYLFLFLLLVLEGWGMPHGRLASLHFMPFVPLLLFIVHARKGENYVRLPSRLTFLVLCYLLLLFLCTLFAIDVQRAFEHRILYIAIFLVSLFAYNWQIKLAMYFPKFLAIAATSTLLYALFVRYFLPGNLLFLRIPMPFQFAYSPPMVGHDTLGAFVLIPLVFLALQIFHKPYLLKIVAFFVLLGVFILSFLRAGYLAFAGAVLFTQQKWIRTPQQRYVLIVAVILSVGFILTTSLAEHVPGLSGIRAVVSEGTNGLYRKSTFQIRADILQQAFVSIYHHPLTGVGTFNYPFASERYAKNMRTITASSHNVFVDIAVENGIPAAIFFVGIVILLFIGTRHVLDGKGTTEKGMYAVFTALFILFFFSHYDKMYVLLTIFFVSAAVVYKEKNETKVKTRWLLLASLAIATINITIVTAKALVHNGYPGTALSIYPIHGTAYQFAASEALGHGDIQKVNRYIHTYQTFYPQNPHALAFIGGLYTSVSEHEKALGYYQKALGYSPLNLLYIRSIYDAMNQAYGKDDATAFLQGYSRKHRLIHHNPNEDETQLFLEWCGQQQIDCSDHGTTLLDR